MTKYLAFSIGDSTTGVTQVTVPGASGVDKLLNDPNIINTVVQNLFSLLIFLAVIVAFGFVIFEGFRYMTSQGSKEDIEKARTGLVNSIIGLVLIFTSFLVIALVGHFFNIQLLQTSLLAK